MRTNVVTTVKKKAAKPPVNINTEGDLGARLAAVEEQVGFLLKGRPGRKYLPIVASEEHVCGVDPSRDSKKCKDASLWRRNKGCKGDACVAVSTKYYQDYRKNKREEADE